MAEAGKRGLLGHRQRSFIVLRPVYPNLLRERGFSEFPLKFRQKLTKDRLVKFWDDEKELGQHVVFGLLEAQKTHAANGWIRADKKTISSEEFFGQQDFIVAVQKAVKNIVGVAGEGDISKKVEMPDPTLAVSLSNEIEIALTEISNACDGLLAQHSFQGGSDFLSIVAINQNVSRALALVDQIYTYAQKKRFQPEVINLADQIYNLSHLLGRLAGERISILLCVDSDIKSIMADRFQIDQAVMNLIVNARDAMPQGGKIEVEIRNLTLDDLPKEIDVEPSSSGYVSIAVSDQGIGIAREDMSRIFHPFYTTKSSGEASGLGLSVVQGIVKQTGGDVFVTSEEGSGAKFELIFPAAVTG